MSLYNMVNGFNPACIMILPMLGKESSKYPRFRDCFISEDKEHIVIFTRVGGYNRNCGFGEDELYEDENFVKTYDDEFDSTYGYYEFKVPDKWKDDYNKIVNCKFSEVSKEYVDLVKSFYPTLDKEGVIDSIFKNYSEE